MATFRPRHSSSRSKEATARYRSENAEWIVEQSRQWREANSEKLREKERRRLIEHREDIYAKNARRRAAERRPSWLTDEQKAEITAFYAEAIRISRETGVKHHVDHIVPLRGKGVTGLHVPWNLRVIPASVNRSKKNNMPEDKYLLAEFV